MTYTVELHKLHEKLINNIATFKEAFNLDQIIMRDMTSKSVWSSTLDDKTRSFIKDNQVEDMDEHSAGMFRVLDEWNDGIRKIRRKRSKIVKYNPVINTINNGHAAAAKTLDVLFPRSTFRVNSDEYKRSDYFENGNCNGFVFCKNPDDYYPKNETRIPLDWYRSVFERGLSVVKSPKGYRFVLSAKRFDADWLRAEDMTAYMVTTTAPTKKIADVETGWLTVFNQQRPNKDTPLISVCQKQGIDELLPHSYNITLPRAVSLLRRRVTTHVLDTVLGV